MSRHWHDKGASDVWLSREAFNALSPAEKRQLGFERRVQKHNRRSARPRKSRQGYHAGQRWTWIPLTLVFAAVATGVDVPVVGIGIGGGAAEASAAVTASFGFCHSGGGINCVVDGDTFYIGGDKVRIAGIDAPETHPPRCAEEAQLGNAATERLQALLNSGAVTMTSIDRDRDVYGRLLRNVQVDGADVGEALIADGVAREYESGRRGWCG